MSAWDDYPSDYRQNEVQHILAAIRAGECVSIVGLSGAGKSNLAGFLVQRCAAFFPFLLVDCNRLTDLSPAGFFQLIRRKLGSPQPVQDERLAVEQILAQRLSDSNSSLCLVLDRFDALPPDTQDSLSGYLRALRDDHKYQLTYVTATRRPLDPHSELAELFYAHTHWLGLLSTSDATWSIQQYARRAGLVWDESVVRLVLEISWGYPAFLRAAAEALAAGCPSELPALLSHPAVQRRVEEFWADQPTPADLRRSGLENHPLLVHESSELTAKEALLLKYLQAHPNQVNEKDDLMRAVWPEIKVYETGIQDDSLAQLVRRLRRKIEPDPSTPRHLINVPGRGYRYIP